MKKIISLILCTLLCTSLIPANLSFAAATYYVNESFNDFPTYMIPDNYEISGDGYYIEEYKKEDKGLAILLGKTPSNLSFAVTSGNKFAVSFDIKYTNKPVTGSVEIKDGAGTAVKIVNFSKDSRVSASNGFPLGGYNASKMSNFTVVYDGTTSTCDVYHNGKFICDDLKVKGKALTNLSSVTFNFVSDNPGEFIVLDNINVSDTYSKNHPVTEYTDLEMEKPDLKIEKTIGDVVLSNTDFEQNIPYNLSYNIGNIIEQRKEANGNTAVYFERTNKGDFHMTGNGVGAIDSDCVVYEFDFMSLHEKSVFNFVLRDEMGNCPVFASLAPGPTFYAGGIKHTIELGKWYHYAVMVDTYDRVADHYFEGKKVNTTELDPNVGYGCALDAMRIHATIYGQGGTLVTTEDPIQFMIDNMKAYEGDAPRDDIGTAEKVVKITNKSIFPSEYMEKKLLGGNIAIHKRSGVVYDGTKKTIMKNTPYTENGSVMVNAEELDSILAQKSGLSGDVILNDYARAIGKVVTVGKSDVNDGLIVLANGNFDMPDDPETMQKLNNFVFNLRPTPQMILDFYEKSPNKDKHPRLQATAEDFARLREEVKTNPTKELWAKRVIASADGVITPDVKPIKYELRDGVRLLSVSREVLGRMYTLGMAYQLTLDKKYADRAWIDLEAVCDVFPDWHPIHDIDLGEMAAAVAIGYDWMYDAFTQEQRDIMAKGIYQNCLYDGAMGFQTKNAPTGGYSLIADNHNVVTNGGMAMCSMAFLEYWPEECSYVIANAMRAVDNMIPAFAPDGAWYEGPHYWEYTMQYTAKMLSSLETCFGSALGLDKNEGLDTSADFMIYMQSSKGIYNYGDGQQLNVYPPELLWLSRKYGNKSIATKLLELVDNKFADSEAHALALIWYDVTAGDAPITLELDRLYKGEDTLVMRNNWKDKESPFVGVHAGYSNISHSQLDGGSFIYDYGNVRWAKDLGMHNYNVQGYWDVEGNDAMRWQYTFSRAEYHNTLVVNPDALADHQYDSYAPLKLVSSKPRGTIAEVDMTGLLHDVSSAKRGFNFTDNRTSLVIRDEVNLKKQSDVYWFMMTDAQVTCDEKGANLTQDGRSLRLDFTSNVKGEISCDVAKPLPTSPNPDGNSTTTSKRIMIKLSGNGNVNLTVKLTPDDVTNPTPVSAYDMPISSWTVPDGEIPLPPSLESAVINNETVSVTSKNIVYTYVEGSLTSVPDISVYAPQYVVNIEKGADLSLPSKITLTDPSDTTNKTIYYVMFKMIPKPKEFDGFKSHVIYTVEASEEPQPQNGILNIVDGDLSTRWSAEGVGQYVIADLREVKKLDKIAIAFFSGETRSTRIKLMVSEDGVTYKELFAGLSGGKTSDYELFDLGGLSARYVKIECNGNTEQASGGWNSLSEIVVMEAK